MDSSITNIMRSISDFVKTKVGEGRTFPRRRSCFRATGLSAIEASHPVRRCAGPTPPRPSTGLPGRGDPLEPPAKKSTPVFRGSTRAKSRNLTQAAIPSNRNLLQGRSAPRDSSIAFPGPGPGGRNDDRGRPIGDLLQACDGLFEAATGMLAARNSSSMHSQAFQGAGGSTSFDSDEPEFWARPLPGPRLA